jgi:hypothetical protein
MLIPIDYSLLQEVDSFQHLVIVRVNQENTNLNDGMINATGEYGFIDLHLAQDRKLSFHYMSNEVEGRETFQVEINNGDHWQILIFPNDHHEVHFWAIGMNEWEQIV